MKNSRIILFMVIFSFMLILLASQLHIQHQTIKSLETQLAVDNGEKQLSPCRYCGSSVEIYPITDSYYIECKGCGIHTRYFRNKAELIDYWNGGKKRND